MDTATGERERQANKALELEISRGELGVDVGVLFCLRQVGLRDGVCYCFYWSRVG